MTYFLTTESTQSVTSVLSSSEAKLTFERPLERVSLAYPIKKQKQAFMGAVSFSINPTALTKINKDLSLKSDVLRFVVVSLIGGSAKDDSRSATYSIMSRRNTRPSSMDPRRAADTTGGLTNEALEQQIREISQ